MNKSLAVRSAMTGPEVVRQDLIEGRMDMSDVPVSKQIDEIIAKSGGWRGETLAELRAIVKRADPAVVEEVKWRKPSRPEGVPVWSDHGIICVADTLKNAVRLTFPKGARIADHKKVFNARLDSNTVRAIDFHEGEAIDEASLTVLITNAVELNG